MTANKTDDACGCGPGAPDQGCCSVEAVLNIDERGQMVLPKPLRAALGVENGGKLAAVAMTKDDEMCCVTLMRADRLEGMVRSYLSPIVSVVLGEEEGDGDE